MADGSASVPLSGVYWLGCYIMFIMFFPFFTLFILVYFFIIVIWLHASEPRQWGQPALSFFVPVCLFSFPLSLFHEIVLGTQPTRMTISADVTHSAVVRMLDRNFMLWIQVPKLWPCLHWHVIRVKERCLRPLCPRKKRHYVEAHSSLCESGPDSVLLLLFLNQCVTLGIYAEILYASLTDHACTCARWEIEGVATCIYTCVPEMFVSVHADAQQASNKSSSDKLIISSREGGWFSQRGATKQRATTGWTRPANRPRKAPGPGERHASFLLDKTNLEIVPALDLQTLYSFM